MTINTNNIFSMSETNQNFSKVAKRADQAGQVVIFKNNKPKYVLMDINQVPELNLTDDEIIDVVAKRVLNRYKKAFMELAK